MWSTLERQNWFCAQTDDVYREGQRPPGRRRGCAGCPKAFAPSTCCSHLARLCPDPHKHTGYVYRRNCPLWVDNIQMNISPFTACIISRLYLDMVTFTADLDVSQLHTFNFLLLQTGFWHIYSWAFMWSGTIRLRSDHEKSQGVKGSVIES